ncbi:MAG: fumarate hydratase C-terminal domain-containing protein [Methanotrichaceae archaeon]|nr:fumarate hydratase C-terminal domain-containing protein [Methanotrichaceae archaeon]
MEYRLQTPLSDNDIKCLRSEDVVYLSGTVYTARDKAHAYIRKEGTPISLEGAALYHCGPLIQNHRVLSAGPTTSSRLSRYTEEILSLGVKAIIGKGGIPAEPFKDRAIYLAYPGGCGALAACQLHVCNNHLVKLGMAEALWEFQTTDMGPMIVAVDSCGGDLYREVRRRVQAKLRQV